MEDLRTCEVDGSVAIEVSWFEVTPQACIAARRLEAPISAAFQQIEMSFPRTSHEIDPPIAVEVP